MPKRPLLSATLICRNEKHNVKRCLDSLWPWVDEVVVVDTGSSDGTVAEFRRYAKRHKQTDKLKLSRVKWADDFAAARQAADDLASGEWLVWADLDDTVHGLERLRELAAAAPPEVRGFFCRYSYVRDESGGNISELWRERVVRNDGTPWKGRLHEHKLFDGQVMKVEPEMAEWIHHRDHTIRTGERNLRILERWNEEEPGDPHVMYSLGLEYMGAERPVESAEMFAHVLACPGLELDRRLNATRHMCVMLMVQGRAQEAKAAALAALAEEWRWADTHLSLAEVEQTLGRPDVALLHAEEALTIGKPDTILIVNPQQYTAHPLALKAVCLAQLGRSEEAVAMAEQCLQIAPGYQLAAAHLPLWRGALKRQQTLATVLALCDVMLETGELVKATQLLAAAPYFVAEEPALIARRVQVSRLISERIERSEVAPEDPAADAFVARALEAA